MSDNSNIEQLIAQCALGNRSAFVELYARTSAKLFAVVLRILNNRADAEDALQEIYVKIWNSADKYALGQYSAMSWLVAIARNQAIDIVRARKPVAGEISEAAQLPDGHKTPEDEALNRSEGARIDSCLAELDSDKAGAVRSAYVDGYSYEELAQRYSVPVNTMRTWLRRSLMKLRECLQR